MTGLCFGYNTNGFAHHRLEDALLILAELGYQSIALTLDVHALNPYEPDLHGRTTALRDLLGRLKLRCVVETGARFLLDPRRKHQPTLLSADAQERACRLEFLTRAIDIATELGADAVSFWSGAAEEHVPARLIAECCVLCEYASTKHMRLAFEPEPGMFIDTMDKFAELHRKVDWPNFGLTLDVGHLHCLGEEPIAAHIRHWRDWLWNVHIEDMRRGVHDHLMFGEGDMDFPPILRALREVGYAGGLHVELSRHSSDAVRTARQALAFLRYVEMDPSPHTK
jgi:sugar phosphate isomerase/epimerase